jgi:hypothetical protein
MAATRPDRCRRKFLRFFPDGFQDETYIDWERGYKWAAHERWENELGAKEFKRLLKAGEFEEIARRAVTIESRTNLLFSFEKMALRDAVKMDDGARRFAEGLYEFLHGKHDFDRWCGVVAELPRRQTRVLTWPIATVFGFVATPERDIFVKPNVTKRAAIEYGFDFHYVSKPNAETYGEVLAFAEQVRRDQRALKPRDMIDLQGFLWVQGSDEYD